MPDIARRRKATPEESAQGQEMKLAEARFQKEAYERGEKAIEDNPENRTDETAEGKMSPPEEGKRDSPLKGTPAKGSTQGSASKTLQPTTGPPPDPPVTGNGDSSYGINGP